MPRRTSIFQKVPWNGGVNSSVDPGMLSPNDLVTADNVQFSTNGSRLKREGLSYYDSAIPAVLSRSSSGTARTLVFASSINKTAPVDQILVAGEAIAVTLAGDSHYNNPACTISSISTTTVTNDTITYTFSGATSFTESLTAETAATVARAYSILGVHDYWYYDLANNTKTQQLFAVTSQGKFFVYDVNGKRTQIVAAGAGATAITGPLSHCDIRTFNNRIVVTLSGVGNTPKEYYQQDGTNTWFDLPGTPPDANYMQEHLGRLWMDDKNLVDRLHYSSTGNQEEWQGAAGDSGALDIGVGDGDPTGISAILPPFKGRLIVHKGTKARQIIGDSPENFSISAESDGIGSVSHKATAAVDQDDVFFMSQRGFHSVNTTDTIGDFQAAFLSKNIQPTFNTWAKSRLQFTQAAYNPTLNTVAWTVSEQGQTKSNAVWLYNPTITTDGSQRGVWYRWPNVNAQCVSVSLDHGSYKFCFGTTDGRILLAQNGTYVDLGSAGITYRVKSGAIYPDGNPQSMKAFKKLTLFFKPRGRYSFTVYFKVDNHQAQAISFGQSIIGDKLGSTFVLGSSRVGNANVLAPFTRDVVGFGRGFSLEIFQTGADAQVEIYGFAVEYETADIAEQTDNSAASGS